MVLALIALVTLVLLGWQLGQPLVRRWRRARLAARPFPAAWRRALREQVPLVARLPADLQLRLKALIQVFLAETPVIGCAGLEVGDAMRVSIAAQACLPLLGRRRAVSLGRLYPRLRQVLLYPGSFVVDRPVELAGGVQMAQRRRLAGESWSQGQVLLSWEDVRAGAADPRDGRNVVIHEFAHQLDQAKGRANGAPVLRDRAAHRRWARAMQAAFDALRVRLARGEVDGLIDAYGATEPAEFFAVVSELFFERATELAAAEPALYEELRRYYALDPRAWQA